METPFRIPDDVTWQNGEKWLKDNLPENKWVAFDVQDDTISVIHTSDSHAFISLGWEGTTKVTLCESYPKEVKEELLGLARDFAEVLNRRFPDGLPEPEENDDNDDDYEEDED